MLEGVQEKAAWALSNLAEKSEEAPAKILAGGGVELLLAAMKRHPQLRLEHVLNYAQPLPEPGPRQLRK